MKELKIKLTKETLEKLELHLKMLKDLGIPEAQELKTVEDLISFYVDLLSSAEYNLSELHKRMDAVLSLFMKKGINFKKLFEFDEEDDDCDEEEDDEILDDESDDEDNDDDSDDEDPTPYKKKN